MRLLLIEDDLKISSFILKGLKEAGFAIGHSGLTQKLPETSRKDEIGVLETEFNSMLARIQKLVFGMKEVTDNIAHDLRSPITRIRGTAEVTLTTGNSLEEFKELAAMTIEECDTLLTIMNTMLYISKTEAGAKKIEKKAVDIADIVLNACELFGPIAEEKKISLITNITSGCIIHGNTSMLQRMVANLIDNALKYTSGGGNVEVSLTCDQTNAKIIFSDNGAGMSQTDIHRIFDRFYRCDNSRSTPGTGLGLSLTNAIVHAHGGTITVNSQLHHGSMFIVMLPRIHSRY